MDFNKEYSRLADMINAELERMISVPELYEKEIYEAMKYSLDAGGKRIRPVITIAFSKMLGGNEEDALTVGTAIECIHTYSLIHDDLPCMDNDDLRRGKPTCHKAFGESTALLAGDGLLNFAFERLSDFSAFKSLSAENLLKIIGYISSCSGTKGMIGGQVVDLKTETMKSVSADMLEYLQRKKTGALIRCSAASGVLCGGGNAEDISAAEKYAEALGLAFQIKDDILDCIGDEKKLGKKTGSDAENGKTTYVSLFGLEKAKELLEKYTYLSVEALAPYGEKAGFLTKLSEYLLEREY